MFRVKICGVTNRDDALSAARAGADSIGLNFYSRSRRYVDLRQAAAIIEGLASSVAKVGVFVNATNVDIRRAVESLGLDFVQLHGEEPPETIAELNEIPVIRAFRLADSGWEPHVTHLLRCQQLGKLPAAVLVEAYTPDGYGGTGGLTDWTIAHQYHDLGLSAPPLILAGGLTPANVGRAIVAVGPFGVDTASGVESVPGLKDAQKVMAFVAAARKALCI